MENLHIANRSTIYSESTGVYMAMKEIDMFRPYAKKNDGLIPTEECYLYNTDAKEMSEEAEEYLQDIECFAEAQEIAEGYLREEPRPGSLLRKFQDMFDI
jgi:hypothetical protein